MLEGKYIIFGDCFDDVYEIRKQCTNFNVLDDMDCEALHVIVYEDKIPIACGRMLINETGYVFDNIYVIEEKRSHKIGKFVVQLLIEKANLMCAKEVLVFCEDHDKGFFESIGFEECRQMFNTNKAKIVMYLDLNTYFSKNKCCQ